MNWVDLALLLSIVPGIFSGWREGFVLSFLGLASWVGSFLLVFLLYPALGEWLHAKTGWGLSRLLAFLLCLVFFRILLGRLSAYLAGLVPESGHLSTANRVAGLFPGAAKGVLFASLLAALLLTLPLHRAVTLETRDSRLAGTLATPISWANRQFEPVYDELMQYAATRELRQQDSTGMILLPFKGVEGSTDEEAEARMLELVNEERARNNLPALLPDTALRRVARLHSADMLAGGYFSHVSPSGSTPGDRLRDGRIRYLTAGENLAFAKTIHMAHTGLMGSPGHRANILRPAFGKVGIGVLRADGKGLMVTQVFSN